MRILWIKTELLHPVDKGGRIRTYQMLRELRNEHEITYLALHEGPHDSEAVRLANEYADEVITVPHVTTAKFTKGFYLELAKNLVSPLPYFMQKYRSHKMRDEIADRVKSGKFDVVVCDFLMPAINLQENLGVPTVLFQHNVEAQIWRRHYETQKNPIKKAYLLGQWRKTFNYERRTCRKFDLVVAVSNEDADRMARDYRVSKVAVVPTGVDTAFFTASPNAVKSGRNIVFTGSMDWLPNEDAVSWFASSIYPAIKRRFPEVSLTVVGRDPSSMLVEQFRGDATIKFTGRVDDVRKYMDEASVYVVPIRIGGGTRLKIYEAMSMGLPIVSTTVGAEGLSYTDGKDILIRDHEEAFAGAVIELLENKELADRIGTTAEARAKAELGWRNVARLFSDHCQSVLAAPITPEKELAALAQPVA